MYKEIIEEKKKELEVALNHFKEEAKKIRTGRANPEVFENLMVDYYGNKTPLKQVASVTVPEARLVLIQPWDTDSLANIEAAIKLSDLNANPNNDGKVIRIGIPPLNEERRVEIVKFLNSKAEEARIAVRNIREEAGQEINKMEKEGKIAEDEKFIGKERLQEMINDYNKKIEEVRESKEKEIMKV
ncbi:MAG: ribosome recycling factor [Candidatus Moranbacteria bacterium]|nr:ribosome recycling factor [Candidatus Moranbacteria bacterium]